MIMINPFDVGGGKTQRMYENLVAVGSPRAGENTNRDLASNQLVQFFLRKFFAKHPELFPAGSKNGRTFLLDGKVGPQTLNGITAFQTHAIRSGFPLFPDSRVSVPIGVNVPGTQMRWTIHALNSFYKLKSGETDFDRLFLNKEIEREAQQLHNELVLREQELAGEV